ncbi:hypothetical protein ACFO5O_02495 [Geojedonia litorea]|uniref:Glycosyltransferase RgtA/B/C/D-like domain-containing protein n=1 Tax=Geojedonia litorea TaxID=1268269 RepID=A0ABV9N2I2_9FLAO
MKIILTKNNLRNPYLWFFIVAFLVTLLQYQLGIRFSYDSNWYIYNASKIGENLDFTRPPVYAPLYGWSLGFLNLIGISTIGSVFIYWWASYLCLLIGFHFLLKNVGLTICCLCVVLSNLTTNNLFKFVWTELGYSALLMFSVSSLYTFKISNNKAFKILFLISIALLPLQRYIGAILSVYLGLVYLFHSKNKIVQRAIELVVSAIPITILVLNNFLLSGHFSGARESATISLATNVKSTIRVLYYNFSPEWIIYFLTFIISFFIIRKSQRSVFLFFICLTPIIQVVSQIYSNSKYHIDLINPRYFIVLTPLLVLLIILIFKETNKGKNVIYRSYFLFITLILSNLFLLKKRDAFINNEPQASYSKIKLLVSDLPEKSKIGVFVKNTVFLQSELILASKIIPDNHCQSYAIKNDVNSKDTSFIPKCTRLNGHTYIPIKYNTNNKPDYVLIDKNGLNEDWKKYFINYNIIDLNSHYVLIKNSIK